MKKFNFKDVPEGYHLCFQTDCPKHGECIRFLAGQHLPDDCQCGSAIYPNAFQRGSCQYFKRTRVIHGAWGFRNIYKAFDPQKLPTLKAKVTNYLGGPVVAYSYAHGDKLLTPEQQDQIAAFCRELGYDKEVKFEGFTFIYDFSA